MKLTAIQRSEVKRAEYISEIQEFKPEMLVFIDETGSDRRNSIRKYGYGLRGLTPISYRLCLGGKRISAIGVLTTRGIEDSYIVEGNVNAGIFLQFIERSLLPILLPFDGDNPRSVVIFDNATIHHVESVISLISAAGALVRFRHHIHESFSKVKHYLRDNEVSYQSTSHPRLLVAEAFTTVTQENCLKYMSHAGYI